jgi:hypothetical protein
LDQVRPKWEEISHCDRENKHYWSIWKSFTHRDGVIYRLHTNKCGENNYQVVVPCKYKDTVMYYVHDPVTSGHLGEKKSNKRLKQNFYWFNCQEEFSRYCKRCKICQARKMPRRSPRAPLKYSVIGVPFKKV